MKIMHYQKGFSILSVILVICAVILVIGVWVTSGQINTNNSSNSSMDVAIESLMLDALALKSSLDIFNMTADPNGFIDEGLFTYQHTKVNPKLIRKTPTIYEGIFVINSTAFNHLPLTQTLRQDITLLVGGINDSACKAINIKYNNTSSAPVITNLPSSSTAVSTNAGNYNPEFTYYTINIGDIALSSGWTKGCFNVKNLPDNNVFFFVLGAR